MRFRLGLLFAGVAWHSGIRVEGAVAGRGFCQGRLMDLRREAAMIKPVPGPFSSPLLSFPVLIPEEAKYASFPLVIGVGVGVEIGIGRLRLVGVFCCFVRRCEWGRGAKSGYAFRLL